MARRVTVLLAAAFVLLTGFAAFAQERRIALVIGNDTYGTLGDLTNARNDARSVAAELKAHGFDVTEGYDLNRGAMLRAVNAFTALIPRYDVAVFYYAGHGVQMKGANYLVPVGINARLDQENDLADESVGLGDIADRMASANPKGFDLLIVDACRDNPFKSKGRSLGATRGLSAPTGNGVMILQSAGSNQTALDRLGDNDRDPNGVFTRELLKAMRVPGLPVRDMVTKLRSAVRADAETIGHQQMPALYDEAMGDFILTPGAGAPVRRTDRQPPAAAPDAPTPQAGIPSRAPGQSPPMQAPPVQPPSAPPAPVQVATAATPPPAESQPEGPKAGQPWLGARVQKLSPDLAEIFGLPAPKGAIIVDIAPDGSAPRSDLRHGDVVLAFNGTDIADFRDLARLAAESQPGVPVTLTVWRGGKTVTMRVTLSPRPTVVRGRADAGKEWIPAFTARMASETPEAKRPVEFPNLGMRLENIEALVRDGKMNGYRQPGLLVANVVPGSIAEAAGLRTGDFILEIQNTTIVTPTAGLDTILNMKRANRRFALILVQQPEGKGRKFVALPLAQVAAR